jgi:H+-transporting ATPase
MSEVSAACRRYYVIVAWIWAFMFYLGLDPLKWLMAYIGNEDGIRDRAAFHAATRKARPQPAPPLLCCTCMHAADASMHAPAGPWSTYL